MVSTLGTRLEILNFPVLAWPGVKGVKKTTATLIFMAVLRFNHFSLGSEGENVWHLLMGDDTLAMSHSPWRICIKSEHTPNLKTIFWWKFSYKAKFWPGVCEPLIGWFKFQTRWPYGRCGLTRWLRRSERPLLLLSSLRGLCLIFVCFLKEKNPEFNLWGRLREMISTDTETYDFR